MPAGRGVPHRLQEFAILRSEVPLADPRFAGLRHLHELLELRHLLELCDAERAALVGVKRIEHGARLDTRPERWRRQRKGPVVRMGRVVRAEVAVDEPPRELREVHLRGQVRVRRSLEVLVRLEVRGRARRIVAAQRILPGRPSGIGPCAAGSRGDSRGARQQQEREARGRSGGHGGAKIWPRVRYAEASF